MLSDYECKCKECLSYRRQHKRLERLRNQSRMKEFDGWKAAVREFYDNKCAKCDSTDLLHIDHILPLSLGGDHAMYNMQILCKPCNFSKSNKNSIDYRKYPKLIAIILS